MSTTYYIVVGPSAIHLGYCLLGHGPTRESALRDSYGERWRSRARRAIVREITEQEFWENWARW
jgi:hypothetical protein